MANRLASETSPYLLQHQNNPVDWFPWGEEAFQKARAENKPVFLSVGYSSCHWCHVMEHESFESEDVAAILNEHFVSVKVDREERPDVDETYMTAVQLTSGRGGWPMSVFLTPDRKPFFAGTYFPKEDRGKYPGFMTVLRQIAQGWQSSKPEFQKAADELADAIGQMLAREAPKTFTKLDRKLLDGGVQALAADFDPQLGGFGKAPKFPPHAGIDFLMNDGTTESSSEELASSAVNMALFTLEAMALGGIHDHVGGGFHRYSTDQQWLLPHFEKMLYDNALLLKNYAMAARMVVSVDPALGALFARTAGGIVRWLSREMMAPEGFFYSALDADSEGEEGKFYVWTEEEVRQVLGTRADAFMKTYRFAREGNFLDEATHQLTGANIPHLDADDAGAFDEDLSALRKARETRVRPGLDDKALVGWNGLAISGLAEAGELQLARNAATAILKCSKEHGSLPHQIAKGRPSGAAFLEDYAGFIAGLLDLALAEELDVPGAPTLWVEEAVRLYREMVEKFYDHGTGGFFATTSGHEMLFGRSKPVFDQPIPSGNALAIRSALRLGDREHARESLESFVGWMERAPGATESLLHATLELLETGAAAASTEAIDAAVGVPKELEALQQPPAVTNSEVQVGVTARELMADPEGVARTEVVLQVPPGLHLNSSNPPARWLSPTKVTGSEPIRVDYPEAPADRYEGEVRIPVEIKLPVGASAVEVELKVAWQACTDTECLPPKEQAFEVVALRS
jgi:uncharacterized protein